MVVKELSNVDIIDALGLCKKFWDETPVFSRYSWDNKKALSSIMENINDDDSCSYIAYDGENPVGIIAGTVDSGLFSQDKWLHADLVYVAKGERRGSIGRKLIQKWIEFGESKDIVDMWFPLNSGIEMDKSVKLFKNMDFELAGVQMKKGVEVCVD